jgi:hypothetical protein
MYSVEAIRGYSDDMLRDILAAYCDAMPESWHYSDAEEYFGALLRNENTIHILLRREQRPIGYLLAIPHNDAVHDDELRQADPELAEDQYRLYIETMEIVPEYGRSLAGGRLFLLMSKALLDEAGKRGIFKFSMHARVTTGLNHALQKIYGDMLTKCRTIEQWPFYNGEEPTEYIEVTYRAERRKSSQILQRRRANGL